MGIRSFAAAALALLSSVSHAQPVPAPNASTWTFIGPAPTRWSREYVQTSGRIRSLAFDPAGTMYVGAEGGGVWRRDGSLWTPLSDAAPTLSIGAVAVAPSNPRVIYAGTGAMPGPVGYYGMGILKSTDGGATWTHIAGPFMPDPTNYPDATLGMSEGGAHIISLAVSPSDPDVVLAGVLTRSNVLAGAGLYRSSDGGLHWTLVEANAVPNVVIFHPTDGHTVYAAFGAAVTSRVRGVYRSVDDGITWDPLPVSEFPAGRWGNISLAMSPSDPRTLYAGISDLDGATYGRLLGFYSTSDGGDHWTHVAITGEDYCAESCFIFNTLAVHPANPSIVAAGATQRPVSVSFDGGVTWNDLSNELGAQPVHPDTTAVAFSADGSTLFAAGDGGIVSTTDYRSASPVWNPINTGLGITEVYPGFDVDPADLNHAFIRTQDNGMQIFNGDLTWENLSDSEGGYIAYDAAADTVYTSGIAMQPGVGDPPYLFSVRVDGLAGPYPYPVPFTLDRHDTSIQYTGTDRVYQTTDYQVHWTAISPALSAALGLVTHIAVAAHDPDEVCAGTTDGHLWCTYDASAGAGSTWIDRSAGLPARAITHVAIDRFKEYEIAATVSGFDDGAGGHVFLSTDSGASWSDISGNLPNAPANSILFDDDVDRLFVATDMGVFRTLDRGVTWAPLARGLPQAHPTDLLMHDATRTLFASTPGRGLWRLTAPLVTGTPPPAVTMSPWRMHFAAHFGGPNPPPQPLSVMNAGSPLWGSTPLHWSASPSTAFGGAWLAASPGSGVDAGSVSVSVDATGLALGTYNGTVRLDDPASSNGPQDLLVLLDVTDTAPMAAAGTDISVDATSPAGAIVALDGTQSSDAEGDPLTYLWTGLFGKVTGATPKVQVPIGSEGITLTVADPAGLSSSATIQVTVNGAAVQVSELVAAVQALHDPVPGKGTATALLATLDHALGSEGTPVFCNALDAFSHKVQAFAGHQLTTEQAAALEASARRIEAVAGCH